MANRSEYMKMYHLSHKEKNRLKSIWYAMNARCYKTNAISYKRYGGKGIKVCAEWKQDFKTFEKWANENGYANNLTIDRIDGNADYCPENCRWVTHKEQQHNTSYNRILVLDGEAHDVTQWSEITGMSRYALYNRCRRGWSDERILTTEVQTKKRGK